MISNLWWSLPLTLIVFFGARQLSRWAKIPLLNPLLISMVVIIPCAISHAYALRQLFCW